MDLGGFERGSRMLFSLPSGRLVALMVAASLAAAVYAGCRLTFIIYAAAVLPLQLLLSAPRSITLRRAYGLVPLILAWGALVTVVRGWTPLLLLPPALLFGAVARFLSSSALAHALFGAPLLALMVLEGVPLHQAAAATLLLLFSLASAEAVTRLVDRRLRLFGGWGLVSAYLGYTLAGDKRTFEGALSSLSASKTVPTYVLDLLHGGDRVGMVVVPHVHPGPYRDLGSSRLPAMIAEAARRRGVACLVLHGASTHGEDLLREEDAARLAELVAAGEGEVLCESERLGFAEVVDPSFRAVALAVGCAALVIVERRDAGMEDIPLEAASGLQGIVLVDAHNSYDAVRPMPSGELRARLVEIASAAAKAAREGLRGGWQGALAARPGRVGSEIGGAGVSILYLASGTSGVALVSFDSNNMLKSLRDKLYERLSGAGATVAIVTTDTHELTGSRPGDTYDPLGTRLGAEECLAVVRQLLEEARANLVPVTFRLRVLRFSAQYLDAGKLLLLDGELRKLIPVATALFAIHFSLFALPLLL